MKGQRKAKVEFSLETLINNPVTKRQLEGFIEEVVLCRGKIKMEKEAISDIVKEAKDALGIPGKILNGLVNEKMNPGSIDAKQHEIDEISDIAEGLGIKE
jgi:uncharacterized protein (UPF0335 family)